MKPTALTEMILARIARRDGTLKSYTTLLADRAMATARVAENELNRGLWREKSQIQALDRTQPGLPLKPGRCSTMTRPPPRKHFRPMFDQIACVHMSGLLSRSHMNAGQDGFRDASP